jgi:hypothetical protein
MPNSTDRRLQLKSTGENSGRRGKALIVARGFERFETCLQARAQFASMARAFVRVFGEHRFKKSRHRGREPRKLLNRRCLDQVLRDDARKGTLEERPPREHEPKRHAQRVDVGAWINGPILELFGRGKVSRAYKASPVVKKV